MEMFNPFTVDHIGPSVIRERSANGKLVIFAVHNGRDETVDTWAKAVKETLTAWPEKTDCLIMHDLEKSGRLAFSAHMQSDLRVVYEMREDQKCHVAFVLPQEAIQFVRLDIETYQLEHSSKFTSHWETFTSRRDALAWLASKLS